MMTSKVLMVVLNFTLLACAEEDKTEENNSEESYSSEQVDSTNIKDSINAAATSSYEEVIDNNPNRSYDENGTLQVTIDNVDSLFVNLRSNTHIYLEGGIYYLDDIDSNLINENVNWALVLFDEISYDEELWNDKTMLISGIENLKISVADDRGVQILTRKLNASVMAFESCKNINLTSLSLGHENETLENKEDPWVSYCSGEVLEFFDSENIKLNEMDLFGCGTRGFLAHRCANFEVFNSTIHDCTYGAFGVFDCENVSLMECTLEDNLYRDFIEIENSGEVAILDTYIGHNKQADEYSEDVLKIDSLSSLRLSNVDYNVNDFDPVELEGE